MAQPIPLQLPTRDPRAELQARLQNAPLDHAEALLSAYELIQSCHDRGVFELLRGAIGSSDKVLDIVVGALNTPESTRGIRNLIILAKTLGTIEPELVEGFARSLPEAIALTKASESKPPGFWGIVRKFKNRNFRRGLVLVNSMLEAFGRNLRPEAATASQRDQVRAG
ncbi:MAG TPA: DUF1641 domain-containing protein [Candidatus Limnocylindrales bacterium]|jgi:uncharacterized protein YjgD (DUF1641 family)|nr:DUF1641 domain-containing protein [Candidatus Limnocylindrales bacterium]